MSTLRRFWCSCLPGDLVRENVVNTCPSPGHCRATEVYVVPVSEVDSEGHRRHYLMPFPDDELDAGSAPKGTAQ